MTTVCNKQLDSAIDALCPEIWKNMSSASEAEPTEEMLWEELVCCILSSQVKFELSQAVTNKLKHQNLLHSKEPNDFYEEQLGVSLRSPVNVKGRSIKYRFPNIKAKQIAAARKNIYENGNGLLNMLSEHSEATDLRTSLVNIVPGLGMKQASMFLRNVSNTFDLAIIDSHVLKYMNVLNLIQTTTNTISKTQYLVKEDKLSRYAEKFGYPVGCVDYAIWIVMRVASKDGYL